MGDDDVVIKELGNWGGGRGEEAVAIYMLQWKS